MSDEKTKVFYAPNGELQMGGQRIDGRTIIARAWKEHIADLQAQLGGRTVNPSEQMLLKRTACLALICEQFEAKLIAGENITQSEREDYRRNVAALRAAFISLGLAKKSRDMKKSDFNVIDAHAEAVLADLDE